MIPRNAPFFPLVESRFPGLVQAVHDRIAAGERAHDGAACGGGSYLWEHTVHVATLAQRIARDEKADPLDAVLAALFHDAGKFDGGAYHDAGVPEERRSAEAAAALLPGFGVDGARARRLDSALRSLYRSGARRNILADIVHDADFLSKFGYLGAAQFFVKSTLRGRTLYDAVMNSLSKELTYLTGLPANMRTRTAARLARARARASLTFFRGFLGELEDATGIRFRVRAFRVDVPGNGRRAAVRLVLPEACDACGAPWKRDFAVERGVKCESLETALRCVRCGNVYRISFCLPEIPPGS